MPKLKTPKDAKPAKPDNAPRDKPLPKLLSIQDAAEAMGVSDATIYRLLEIGSIPSIKIGARRKIAHHDLWVYINSQRSVRKPKAEPAELEPKVLTAEERTAPLNFGDSAASA